MVELCQLLHKIGDKDGPMVLIGMPTLVHCGFIYNVLSAQAITSVLFETPGALEDIDVVALNQIWLDLVGWKIGISNAMSDPVMIQLTKTISQLYQTASLQSRTGKLWIQHVDQVSLMKQFVRAERSGYFSLHLHTIA